MKLKKVLKKVNSIKKNTKKGLKKVTTLKKSTKKRNEAKKKYSKK